MGPFTRSGELPHPEGRNPHCPVTPCSVATIAARWRFSVHDPSGNAVGNPVDSAPNAPEALGNRV